MDALRGVLSSSTGAILGSIASELSGVGTGSGAAARTSTSPPRGAAVVRAPATDTVPPESAAQPAQSSSVSRLSQQNTPRNWGSEALNLTSYWFFFVLAESTKYYIRLLSSVIEGCEL
ncbi:hypothetical protein Pelo_17357 [Pelomyxa schiedti]|nr:hypothetical protein Pelo_17357 [Pelomyxa schiedti]